MPASEELAKRVLEAGRCCSLTKAVLEGWARAGSPKQVEYPAAYLGAERASREASRRASLVFDSLRLAGSGAVIFRE